MSRSDPCEYSQFCATWGFCEECDAPLYRAMVIAEAAMREAGVPSNSQRAVPYVQILHALRLATGRPIPGEPAPEPAPSRPGPLRFPCPTCGVEPMRACRNMTAREHLVPPHTARIKLANPTTTEETPS